jgi:hypothetical protein
MKNLALIIAFFLILDLSASAREGSISQMMTTGSMLKDDDDLNLPSFLESESGRSGKSKFLALGLSFLLPGSGQYYTENKRKAIIFGSAEALIWGGFFGLRQYGSWKKEDYKAYAAFHAGANVNGKPDIFFEKLTYYDNINEYNQLAVLYDGEDAVLFPVNSSYYWNWDSRESRDHFRNLRNLSKNAYRRSLFMVGAALANRILAGIDAYRSASMYETDSEFSVAGWRPYYEMSGPIWNSEVEIGVIKNF